MGWCPAGPKALEELSGLAELQVSHPPGAPRAHCGLEVGEGRAALERRGAKAVLLEPVDPREERPPSDHPAADHQAPAVVAPAGGTVAEQALDRAQQREERDGGPSRRNEAREDA